MAGHRDPSQVPEGVFWADYIKGLRDDPESRLAVAKQYIPLPAAFREAAIALRALIRQRRKAGESIEPLLSELFQLAAQNDLLLRTPYIEGIGPGFNVVEMLERNEWDDLPMPYDTLGYEQFALLNKTDRRWVVEAWGEPSSHQSAQQYYHEFWTAAVERCRARLDRQRAQFKSDLQNLLDSGGDQSAPKRRGCGTVLLVIILVLGALA